MASFLKKSDKPQELPPTNYYILSAGFPDGAARISIPPALPARYDNWITGNPVDAELPSPLEYQINEEHSGVMRHYFQATGAPLMSKDLLLALEDCGVDNLQVFDANIVDHKTTEVYTNYKSVNVIGMVSAVDLGKSEYTDLGLGGDQSSSLFFKKMFLDESRCHGLLMFRLAEKPSALVVHATVRAAIGGSRVDFSEHLVFTHPMKFS